MNAGAEQRLIGIDIADAAEKVWFNSSDLMRVLRRFSSAAKSSNGDLQRLRTEPRDARGKLLAEFDAAELPAVVEQQHAAIEGEDRVGVLAGVAAEQQAAGHAEVDHQVPAAFDATPR